MTANDSLIEKLRMKCFRLDGEKVIRMDVLETTVLQYYAEDLQSASPKFPPGILDNGDSLGITRIEKRLEMANKIRALKGRFDEMPSWTLEQAALCKISEALAVLLEELP